MAFTQTQLLALEEAIASGVLIVEYDGMKKQYRDSDHLMKTYNFVKAQLQSDLDMLTRNPRSIASFR